MNEQPEYELCHLWRPVNDIIPSHTLCRLQIPDYHPANFYRSMAWHMAYNEDKSGMCPLCLAKVSPLDRLAHETL